MASYFTYEELSRVSSYPMDINPDSLKRLNRAREIAGIPFIVTSAYRSPEHNKRVGGAPDSAHLRGRAFDIRCNNTRERYCIIHGALAAGFTRIGVGKSFVHLDDDPSLPQCVIWTY